LQLFDECRTEGAMVLARPLLDSPLPLKKPRQPVGSYREIRFQAIIGTPHPALQNKLGPTDSHRSV